MELSEEKSIEQAEILKLIALPILSLDTEYCKECAKAMQKDASMADSTAAMNPSYNPTKTRMIRVQASALEKLVEYVETLREVDKLKNEVSQRDDISKHFKTMFG